MGIFILRHIGQTLIVLAIASIIVFALIRLIPGDPIQVILGGEYSPQAEAALRQQLGLDRSIVVQYVIWIGNVLRGEFGYSYINHERVSVLLWNAFLSTLSLVIGTTIVGLLIALPSGIIAAIKRDALLQDADALGGLNEAEVAHVHGLAPRLQTMCARLAQSPIPPTLVHGDLYLKNVAIKAGRYQFFDWTDACVAHPFLDMSTIYTETDVARHTYLRDAYLALWAAYAPRERLLEDWALARPLCHLHQAISYQHIVAGLEVSAQTEFRRMVPYFVRQLVQAMPPGGQGSVSH